MTMPHLITWIGLLILLTFIYTAGSSCTVSAPSGPRTIRFGSQHTITCQFSANCFSSFWTKDGLSLSNNPSYTISSDSTRSSISFNASLSDTGDFVCNVIRFHFSASTTKRYFRIFVEKAVEVQISPNAINSVEGEMVSINCTAIGAPIPSSISWYRNGLLLNPVPKSYKSTDQQTVTSRHVLQPLEKDDEGTYSCSAFNTPSSIGFKTAHSSDTLVTVYYLPLFILQPPSIAEGIAGGNISLFCSVAANPLPPVVYWLTSNGLNLTNISTSVAVSPKVIESTLTLENLQLSHELNYSCVVEQVIPSNNNRTLIKAQTQLLITCPPQVSSPIHKVTVNVSDEVTLSCEGFGNPRPVIEWYFTGKDGNEVQIHTASRSLPLSDRTIVSNLTLTNVTIDQEGSYRCKGNNNVTNLIGSKEDTSIHFTVHSPPQLTRVNSSSNYSLLVNESITLSFSISSASPQVKSEQIFWTLTTVNGEIKQLNSSNQLHISADGLSLTILSVSLEENGFVQLTVSNEVGTDSKGYYLLIGTSPSVSILPRHVGVPIGTQNISFTCTSSGHPIPLLTWYVNGQELSLSQDKYSSLYANGTSVLTLFDIGLSDAARYTCFASNLFGNDTVDNHLVVQVPPNVTLTPSQVTVSVNDSLQLVCTSYGIPSVVLTWYFGTSNEPLESREDVIDISQKTIGYNDSLIITTSILTIENITNAYWQGVFICEGFNGVTNLIGTPENDTSEIDILIPPKVNVVGSNNLTAVLSRSLTIAVSLSISSPPVTLADIMWSFTNASGYTVPINNSERYQFSTNLLTLTINNVSYSDEGTYQVSVSTTVGNDSAVIVVDVQTPPIPVAFFTETNVLVGSNVTLSCEAASKPIHEFQWKFNPNDVAINEIKYIISDDHSGEYGQLIITNTSPSDAGEYTCTVSNVHGAANITVILDILVPPVLQYQPKSEPPYVDHSYNISVRVTSIPNPPVNSSSIVFKRIDDASLSQVDIIYDESRRLVNISFTNISISDTGTYQLTVKNLAGEDTVNITLNIKASPQIYSTLYSILLQEGESTSVECRADGLPLPSITWLANRRQIGAFSNTFTITTVAIDSIRQGVPAVISRLNATDLLPTHNGSYECVVENQEGTARIQYNISVIPIYFSFCDHRPCSNGGTCVNGPSGYLCMCTEGWTERNCTKFATEKSKPQFLSSMYNRTFYQEFGSTVLLSCPVTGYPQPNIIWFKDDVLLVGAITEDYEIKKLDLNTRGIYQCNASNELGSIASGDIPVKIRGLVQYQANIAFSQKYIRSFIDQEFRKKRQVEETFKATEERLNKLVGTMNSEMRKILSANKSINFSYISLELLSSSTINSLLDNITVVLSLESKSRGTAELTSAVTYAFSLLNGRLEDLSHISDSVDVDDVRRFDGCPAEQTTNPSPNDDPTLEFILNWQETDLTQMATLRCPCGPENFDIGVVRNATRRCGGDFKTGAVWESPIDKECNFSIAARKLCSLAFSLQKPDRVLAGLENITAVSSEMGPLELSIAVSLIDNLKTEISGNNELTDSYFTIADNIISTDSNMFIESNEESSTSRRLLQSFETITENYPIPTDETTIVLRRRFLVVAQGLNVSHDRSDNFSLSIATNGNGFSNTNHPVSLNNNVTDPLASIVIPGSILNSVISEATSTVRLIQTAFDNDLLFLRRSSLLSNWSHLRVGSVLISATFAQHDISNQEDLITITLKKDEDLKANATRAYCSFWDHASDDYYGNWSNFGCSVLYEDSDIVICGCNHLTTFALLLDVAPNESTNPAPLPYQQFVNSVTFLGCAVSILCLVVIILTYSIEKHLRNTNNGKLLINMSCALVGLYISFIPASYAAPIEGLCVVVGAFLHYFFLAAFLSMASEATILYVELVKVFAKSRHGMIIKAVIVTWVTPFLIVGFTIAPNYKNYIYKELNFCRPTQWQFWIGFIGPFVSIYLYNWIMFLIIIVSLFKQQCKTQGEGNSNLQTSFKKQALLVITLSILFGLAWGIGLAATSSISIPWLRYTLELSFVIAAGLQGVLIFILYGLRISKVRKTWLKWIYIVTSQHVKAVEIDQTLRSTYTIRRSIRLKQSTYSLGTYADTNVELKYKLPLTQSTTANSCSSSTNSSSTNADTPLSDSVKEKEKVVHFIDNNDKPREDKLTSTDEHCQVDDNEIDGRQMFDAVGENDTSQKNSEEISISDLVPEPV